MPAQKRKIKKVISVSLDEELVAKMDEIRNREPRSSFVNRTLRTALGMPED